MRGRPNTRRSRLEAPPATPPYRQRRVRKRANRAVSESASQPKPTSSPTAAKAPGGFGPNEWLVDELYQQYLADKDSVDAAWWDFFKDYRPTDAAGGPVNGSATARGPPANGSPAPPS